MFQNDFEERSSRETNYEMNMIEYTQKTLNFGLYTKLSQFEQHFDTLSTKYKNIALTWLIATFAGIGFILSSEVSRLPFDHMIAVAIISFLGFLGNSLIWNLDVNVYNPFWCAVFIEEVRMEKKFKFLLNSRNIDLSIGSDEEKIFSHGLLYIVGNFLLLLTMGSAIIYFLKKEHWVLLSAVILSLLCVLFFVISFMFKRGVAMKKIFDKLIKEKPKK